MCRGPEPPLAVGAPQVRQGAPLLKPAVHSHLDITVHIPVKWTTLLTSKRSRVYFFRNMLYIKPEVVMNQFWWNISVWHFFLVDVLNEKKDLNQRLTYNDSRTLCAGRCVHRGR